MADLPRETVVTDIKIPFWSMVVLLVKWALASIPALIVLIVIGAVISAALNALFGGVFQWWGPGRSM
jgi:hypothetical protein